MQGIEKSACPKTDAIILQTCRLMLSLYHFVLWHFQGKLVDPVVVWLGGGGGGGGGEGAVSSPVN